MYWFCREGLGCSVCTRSLQVERKWGGLFLAWTDLLYLFLVSCFQIWGPTWLLFLTFATLYTTFYEVVYYALLSGSIRTLVSYRHEVCAGIFIHYWLWWHKKHNSAFSHLFWFVYNFLCLLPFTGHKWLGSGTSGNRVLLYWCNRCSPAGCLWHRHIFCEVAGTMVDSGSPSSYVFQLLLPIFGCSVCRITVASSCWVQEWMKYSQGVFCRWKFLGYCSLSYFLSFLHCIRATDFSLRKHPRILKQHPTSLKNSDFLYQLGLFFSYGILSLRLKGPLKQKVSISVLIWMARCCHKSTYKIATAADCHRLGLPGLRITLKILGSFQHLRICTEPLALRHL